MDISLRLSAAKPDCAKAYIQVGGITIGKDFAVIAGPCAIESEEQIMVTAHAVKQAGANILRGGAFKPRTSPYSFQGLGRTGLQYLQKASEATGLPTVTEVMDTRDVSMISEYVDVLQVGARNMQNYSLLMEIGRTRKPVILKRGLYATIQEWINSAEYIMKEGNNGVILCERGIRTIETYTRNTLDISAVAVLKELSSLPIIVDPSHATGKVNLIGPMSNCAVMAGADGIMIEVHPNPPEALSDEDQQLTPEQFESVMKDVRRVINFKCNNDNAHSQTH